MERPRRGLGPGGGAKSQPGRAGCRCGGGRKGPEASAWRMQAGRGRGRVRSTAHEPRGARGGAGTGPGHALTVRSGAPRSSRCHGPRPRRAQPPQQQAAPPQPPRSILTLTCAPQPRATLRCRKWRRRRRARPTMLCAVTSPALEPPGGAPGKLRLGSAGSPPASSPCVGASDREALLLAPPPVEEGKNARRPGPTLCGSLPAAALDLQPGLKGRLASSVAPGPRTAAWLPSCRPDSAAGWRVR